jgi:hypothetical protein
MLREISGLESSISGDQRTLNVLYWQNEAPDLGKCYKTGPASYDCREYKREREVDLAREERATPEIEEWIVRVGQDSVKAINLYKRHMQALGADKSSVLASAQGPAIQGAYRRSVQDHLLVIETLASLGREKPDPERIAKAGMPFEDFERMWKDFDMEGIRSQRIAEAKKYRKYSDVILDLRTKIVQSEVPQKAVYLVALDHARNAYLKMEGIRNGQKPHSEIIQDAQLATEHAQAAKEAWRNVRDPRTNELWREVYEAVDGAVVSSAQVSGNLVVPPALKVREHLEALPDLTPEKMWKAQNSAILDIELVEEYYLGDFANVPGYKERYEGVVCMLGNYVFTKSTSREERAKNPKDRIGDAVISALREARNFMEEYTKRPVEPGTPGYEQYQSRLRIWIDTIEGVAQLNFRHDSPKSTQAINRTLKEAGITRQSLDKWRAAAGLPAGLAENAQPSPEIRYGLRVLYI